MTEDTKQDAASLEYVVVYHVGTSTTGKDTSTSGASITTRIHAADRKSAIALIQAHLEQPYFLVEASSRQDTIIRSASVTHIDIKGARDSEDDASTRAKAAVARESHQPGIRLL